MMIKVSASAPALSLTKRLKGVSLVALMALSLGYGVFTPQAMAQDVATKAAPPVASANEPVNSREIYDLIKLFSEVFERVRADYVEPAEEKKLIQAAINGMLTSLDPHSGYMSPDDFKSMQVETRGIFGGLGIEVTMENGFVKVVSPIDDTPASRAGIQPGDLFIALDDVPVIGLTLEDAVKKMRGTPGTDIKLTVVRGKQEPFPVTLTRAIIKVESVRWAAMGTVGYVRITNFSERTQAGLDKAITDLKSRIGPDKVEGWVLDLRNNPGGLLEQAVSVSDTFLNEGEIVSTRGRNERDNSSYKATAGDMTDGKPMVVLINGGSASASEIVSGALKDHDRAVLMGTKSFGKGSVQSVVRLNMGAMRLTTARYYTPSGVSIQAEGIEPDIVVEPAKVEKLEESTLKYNEAVLPGALDVKTKGEPQPAATKAEPLKPESKAATPAAKEDEKHPEARGVPDPTEDYQLQRALDLIHGISLYGRMKAGQSEGVAMVNNKQQVE
jgi:carboxyl-terminal processing protease